MLGCVQTSMAPAHSASAPRHRARAARRVGRTVDAGTAGSSVSSRECEPKDPADASSVTRVIAHDGSRRCAVRLLRSAAMRTMRLEQSGRDVRACAGSADREPGSTGGKLKLVPPLFADACPPDRRRADHALEWPPHRAGDSPGVAISASSDGPRFHPFGILMSRSPKPLRHPLDSCSYARVPCHARS